MAFVITDIVVKVRLICIKSVLLPVLFFCGNTPDSAFGQYGHVISLGCSWDLTQKTQNAGPRTRQYELQSDTGVSYFSSSSTCSGRPTSLAGTCTRFTFGATSARVPDGKQEV